MKSKATLKIVLDPTDKSEKKLLKLRVTFDRKPHLYSLNTEKRLSVEEFSNDKLKAHKDAMAEAKKAYDVAVGIVEEMGTNFSFEQFKKKYRGKVFGEKREDRSFAVIANDYIHKLDVYSTRQNYTASANWIDKVHSGIRIDAIDDAFVDLMVGKMKDARLKENSIRIYCRQLKAIFQQAINDGLVKGPNPFTRFAKRSIGRTLSGLTEEEFTTLLQYEAKSERVGFGKDFFILSFACSGANIGDLLSLKNVNIQGDNISFIRRKTKKNPVTIVIPLLPVAEEIFNKYGHIDLRQPNYYILPYLADCDGDIAIRNRIHDVIKRINKGLSELSADAGLRKITTYDARHTYATLARDEGLTKEQLQKLLGHSSSNTTEAYLDKLTGKILKKNKEVISGALKTRVDGTPSLEAGIKSLIEKYGEEDVLKILNAAKKQ